MLWPLILPVQIAFWVLVGILLVTTVASPKIGWKRKRVLTWGTLLALQVFVPTSYGIMIVLDQYRFGIFTYQDFQSIDDFRVERYLPESAKEITIDKHMQGYRAKYKITKNSLAQWFDQQWDRHGEHSAYSRTETEKIVVGDYETRFKGLDWPPLPDVVKYVGPRAANGAGFTLWYSESTETVYQHAGYW